MKRVSNNKNRTTQKPKCNNNVYIAVIIALVGLFIVLTPVILENKSVVSFTSDSFNVVALCCIAIVLFFVDIRIGVVFAILLLSVISYGYYHNETFMMPELNNTVQGISTMPNMTGENNLSLDDHYKHHSSEIPIVNAMPKHVETFTNQCGVGDTDKLPSENFTAPVDFNSSTEENTTTTPALPNSEDNIMPVDEYMKRLQGDITKKLSNDKASYDVVACRYDMTDSAQNTTTNGPPLSWNNTYTNTTNGQLFYPLHG